MSEQQPERTPESLRHEYTETVQSIRHYSNLRFAIYTIFFAVLGGIGLVAFGKGQFEAQAAKMARISAFPVIALFWWYQERVNQFFVVTVGLAIELEKALGYKLHTSRPGPQRFRHATGIVGRAFFLVLALIWTYAVYTVPYN